MTEAKPAAVAERWHRFHMHRRWVRALDQLLGADAYPDPETVCPRIVSREPEAGGG